MSIRELIYKFSKTRKYEHVISLGYNCEISYQFYCNYKFTQSHLFSWAYIPSDETLLRVLANINDIYSEGIGNEKSLFSCKKYNIYFHNRKHKESLYNEDGSIREDIVKSDREELSSRISYLKQKFNNAIVSEDKKLFIIKPQSNYETIKKLKELLNDIVKNGYNLLIVTENHTYDEYKLLEDDITFVRKISKYTPDECVTNKKKADMKGWKKIFKEFGPSKILKEKKTYKFEDID